MNGEIVLRTWDLHPYLESLEAMRTFTENRDPKTPDELWILEHPPVYTLGQAGKHEHILDPGNIPVVQSCRGGQVTYHGPGQLVLYPLLDLKRSGKSIKDLILSLQHAVLGVLHALAMPGGHLIEGAPGVYIDGAKVAQLGLRVKRGCSYHGLSLNVNLDTAPFKGINPCGYTDLKVCTLSDFKPVTVADIKPLLVQQWQTLWG